MCPYCQSDWIIKRGFYSRPSDGKRIQRYSCKRCLRRFSAQSFRIDFRYRKRHLDQLIFRGLCKGNSQRALAYLLHIKPATVARRIERFGQVCEQNLHQMRSEIRVENIMIDEMESFEHSMCKPLTMPIAIEKDTRRVIALDVAQIAAKGHLAKISRKKYGPRACHRSKALTRVFAEMRQCFVAEGTVHSDMSPHYPGFIARVFPQAKRQVSKGRRGCTVGQGELKEGGIDPLFSLNHTYAMFRDNLKRLSRRTWCTTKRPDQLRALMMMYAWFHNLRLIGDRGTLKVVGSPFTGISL